MISSDPPLGSSPPSQPPFPKAVTTPLIPTPSDNQSMIRFLSFRLLRRSVAHPQETGSDLHKAQVSKCMDQNHPMISPFSGD